MTAYESRTIRDRALLAGKSEKEYRYDLTYSTLNAQTAGWRAVPIRQPNNVNTKKKMNLTPSQILDHNMNLFEFPSKSELTKDETNLSKRYVSEYRKLKSSSKALPFSQITQENLLREAILQIELSQKRRQTLQTLRLLYI